MREDFPPTLSELEMLQAKLIDLLAHPKMLESTVERKTMLSGLGFINEKVVGMRALIAAATDPNFKDCA